MKSKLSLHAFNPVHAKQVVENYHQHMDKIIVGNNKFGLRQVSEFEIEDIKAVTEVTSQFNIDCFVAVNKIMHNRDLEQLELFLINLDEIGADGVIFSDLAIPFIIEKNNLKLKQMYMTETTITNSGFSTFAKINNIDCVEVANELTLEEVNQFAKEKEVEVSVQIHGHLYMYQSIRNIVDNFSQFQEKDMLDDNMYLFDEERKKTYPLIQNEQGTHLLAGNNLAMIHKLNEFDLNAINFLRIDPLLYSISEYNQIIDLYVKALKLLETNSCDYENQAREMLKALKEIKKEQKYSTGFFYKKTMF